MKFRAWELGGLLLGVLLGSPLFSAENSLQDGALGERSFKEESWNLHAQATVIPQGHLAITSPYSLPGSSLSSQSELNTSVTSTLFTGAKLWSGMEGYLNPEVTAGSGISGVHGIAGFPNGEIYRVGDSAAPRLALSRIYLRQTFGLGGEKEKIEGGPNQLASRQDISRVSVTMGKFSLNDAFDNNAYSHDPRSQFMNWALMDNGAWDYAADTRGYSWGFVVEFNQRDWAVRLASVLEPVSANMMELDTNISQAHGDNLEFEYRYDLWKRPGKARVLAFWNHARMGNYQTTLNDPSLGMNVTNSRTYCGKYGFGLNFEQELTDDVGGFVRLGWNDGATETWAFTEIDQAMSLGVSIKGSLWGRPRDNLGIAYLWNSLSNAHANYLRAGGIGFMVGDGKLNFSPEQIIELYYALKPIEAISLSADLQQVFNPGYNQDRGPVTVISARVHAEL